MQYQRCSERCCEHNTGRLHNSANNLRSSCHLCLKSAVCDLLGNYYTATLTEFQPPCSGLLMIRPPEPQVAVICGETRKHGGQNCQGRALIASFSSSAASKISSRSRVLSSCTTGVELACVGWSHRAHSSGGVAHLRPPVVGTLA